MNKRIQEIVSMLEASGLFNANAVSVLSESSTAERQAQSMADAIKTKLLEGVDGDGSRLISEDAAQTAQLIANMLQNAPGQLSEAATETNVKMITAAVATLIRNPYECHVHRLFYNEVTQTPEYVIEEVTHYVKAPGNANSPEPVYEAFKTPGAFSAKVSTKIAAVGKAGVGIAVTEKSYDLIGGDQPKALRVNRTIKLEHITVKKISDQSAVDAVVIKRGSSPYVDAATGQFTVVFEVTIGGVKHDVTVGAQLVNDRLIQNITFSNITDYAVTHIHFDASVSHEEHTAPITLSVSNKFTKLPIGTREHIEVGETIEKIVDIKKSTGSQLSGTDITTLLADRVGDIAFRVQDDRLMAALNADAGYLTGDIDLKQSTTSQFFKISEFINDQFFNQIDGYCTMLKVMHNFENCHFVAEINPVLAQFIDAERSIVKGDAQSGKTAFMYDMKYKSKSNEIMFVVAPKAKINQVRINLIPDDVKKTPYRTYDLLKYDSFLTDKLRRHDNPTQTAIVYSERNQEYIHNAFSIVLTVKNIPALSTTVINKIKEVNASLIVE